MYCEIVFRYFSWGFLAFYIDMLSFATVIIEDAVLINNSSVEHAVAIAIRSAN